MKHTTLAQHTSQSFFNKKLGVIVFSFLLLQGGAVYAQQKSPTKHLPQYIPRTVTKHVTILQTRLLNKQNSYPLEQVLAAGGQFFTVHYTPSDGQGEGLDGPRSGQSEILYPRDPTFPFLKLNGLGAQSCFDCHNSAGPTSYEYGNNQHARIASPHTVGGGGGFAANLFQNDSWPDPLVKFYRNPPHVFGSGYTQRLATEMTHELQCSVFSANQTAEGQQKSFTTELTAKGMSFGEYTAEYSSAGITPNYQEVMGVLNDMVIRPFQFKGISSSVRHFTHSALDFHFSMQSSEIVPFYQDCDEDGYVNEMAVEVMPPKTAPSKPSAGTPTMKVAAKYQPVDESLGNVSALVTFVAMTRPPYQKAPPGVHESSIKRGKEFFEKHTKNPTTGKKEYTRCAMCHTPELTIETPILTVSFPPTLPNQCSPPAEKQLGSRVVYKTDELPTIAHLKKVFDTLKKRDVQFNPDPTSATTPASFFEDLKGTCMSMAQEDEFLPPGYQVHLTNPPFPDSFVLNGYISPRLPAEDPKSPSTSPVSVPLYSDLKLHNMGPQLAGPAQEADVAGYFVPESYFLTRPLWGVADTGPWLHDGRARTLYDAIMAHADRDGTGKNNPYGKSAGPSEATEVIRHFAKLKASEQQDVINFLLSLRLPPPLHE